MVAFCLYKYEQMCFLEVFPIEELVKIKQAQINVLKNVGLLIKTEVINRVGQQKTIGKYGNLHRENIINREKVGIQLIFYIYLKMIYSNNQTQKQYFSFKSIDSEKVIGLSNCKGQQGNLIIQCDFAEESQCFLIVPEQEDFHIKCKMNSLYLTVENMENGCRVYCAEKSNQPNQKFRIEETEPGSKEYFIFTFCGKALEVAQSSSKGDVIKVIQNEHNGSSRQRWTLNDIKNITCDS